MAKVPIDRVVRRLWPVGPDGAAFAVLDGARDPGVHRAVTSSGLPHRCLYVGDIAPSLARAAPWLVQLAHGEPASVALLQRAWGEAWGVFLRAPVPLPELHRHLRRFLRVRDERGRRLLFRYYDPRVLRVYLPTCTPEELAFVFGPIQSFVVEGDGDARVLEFRRGEGGLDLREEVIERRLHWLGDYLRKERERGG